MHTTYTFPVLSLSHLAIMTRHYLEATAGDRDEPLQSAQTSRGFFVNLENEDAGRGFPELRALRAWLEIRLSPITWVLFEEDGYIVDELPTYLPYSEVEAAKDQQLLPCQLAEKYGHTEAGHPCLPVSQWRTWVTEGHTIEGYWDWVAEQLQESDYYGLIGNQTA
ncbi:hypothetical protein CEK28_03835 [Xenophilus sp. AP218F]|nr:hypothetical protein CEK28_03835 [Xenophilus sp. AP218F]